MPHSPLNWADAAANLSQRGEAYVLITVLYVKGSAPRDAGTKMLVTSEANIGTIGGGHLEHAATARAQKMLLEEQDSQYLEEFPLGPKLGQCCGGRVNILYESFAATALPVALFGAGHVARALVAVLAQLPVRVTWIDSREQEFPAVLPPNIKKVLSEQAEDEVANLTVGSYVLAMTHLHPLDYAIAEKVLKRGDAAFLGVIGSATKAQRFRLRLRHRGFSQGVVDTMQCPVGDSNVPGKQPMEVAVSIAAQLIAFYQNHHRVTPTTYRLNAPATALTSPSDHEDSME